MSAFQPHRPPSPIVHGRRIRGPRFSLFPRLVSPRPSECVTLGQFKEVVRLRRLEAGTRTRETLGSIRRRQRSVAPTIRPDHDSLTRFPTGVDARLPFIVGLPPGAGTTSWIR